MTTEELIESLAVEVQAKETRLKQEKNPRQRQLLEKEIRSASKTIAKLKEVFCVPEEYKGAQLIRTPEGWLFEEPEKDD